MKTIIAVSLILILFTFNVKTEIKLIENIISFKDFLKSFENKNLKNDVFLRQFEKYLIFGSNNEKIVEKSENYTKILDFMLKVFENATEELLITQYSSQFI